MEDVNNVYSVEALLQGLRAVASDESAVAATLWTWLEGHLLTLGSLREKPPALRRAAVIRAGNEAYAGIDDGVLQELAVSPVRNAAELLARIALHFEAGSAEIFTASPGIDGTDVVVAVRRPALIAAMGSDKGPPTSVEHPSLTTLSPRLVVCPAKMNGVELQFVDPEGLVWEQVFAPMMSPEEELEEGEQKDPKPSNSFQVHLDTLGSAGLTGWNPDPDKAIMVGTYDPSAIDPDDLVSCENAAAVAVTNASGPASLLVMPELAGPPPVLERIEAQLREESDAPLITVIGAYHEVPADLTTTIASELLGDAKLSEHVNEAIAFGPDGTELWRQRKMSCAGGGGRLPDERFLEDIRLGDRLMLVPTPLGTTGIVICLDAFVPHVRERLLRSPLEILLVPSLSPSLRRHRESLVQLVHVLWGAAFVCNRSPYPEGHELNADGKSVWNDDENRSFWIPDQGDGNGAAAKLRPTPGHPSFVFSVKSDDGDLAEEPTGA
jgi:predicted amidohydrolase